MSTTDNAEFAVNNYTIKNMYYNSLPTEVIYAHICRGKRDNGRTSVIIRGFTVDGVYAEYPSPAMLFGGLRDLIFERVSITNAGGIQVFDLNADDLNAFIKDVYAYNVRPHPAFGVMMNFIRTCHQYVRVMFSTE